MNGAKRLLNGYRICFLVFRILQKNHDTVHDPGLEYATPSNYCRNTERVAAIKQDRYRDRLEQVREALTLL